MADLIKNESSFRPTSPGEVLKKMLKAKEISQTDFAKNIGMSKSHVSDIIHGRISISKQIAEKIGSLLGPNPEFWFNMQTQYLYDLKRLDPSAAEALSSNDQIESFDAVIDVNVIIKRLGLSKIKPSQILEDIKSVIKSISSTNDFNLELSGLFRKSVKTGLDERMAKTWIVIAKYICNQVHVSGVFAKSCEEQLCTKLRMVFNENVNVIDRVTEILSEYGIRFSVVEKVERASIEGFSYVQNGIPSIVVTKRYNKIDNLAFNVMHELGHIFLHLSNNENSSLNIPGEYNVDDKEETANSFAKNALISDDLWENAPSVPMNVFIIQREFTKWARRNNINKWIALGRIAQETGMYKFKDDNQRKIG